MKAEDAGDTGAGRTPPYARYLIRLIRPYPNFDFFFIKPMRQRAVELLQLKSQDRVLDAGCGPGGCFPYLVDAVGPSGKVVGLEISAAVLINARKRIQQNAWNNVELLEADARTVALEGMFDGLLTFAAADVYASPQALANLLPHLRKGARVVAFGAKLSRGGSGAALNLLLRMLWKLSFSSTPRLDYKPWAALESHVDELHVEEFVFGCMFLAWGSVSADHQI